MSMQIERRSVGAPVGAPAPVRAGGTGRGEYVCAGCGYGITVRATLPECPMCRGEEWEESAASAYARPPL